MNTPQQISCPNCGTAIDVNDILSHQVEEELQKKYNARLALQREEFLKKEEQLTAEKEQFEERKRRENELFQERFETKMKEERQVLEKQLRAKLTGEQADQFAELQKELNEKSEQVKDLNKSKAEIERLKREKDELKEAVEAESQRKLSQQLGEEKQKLQHQMTEEKERIRRAEEEKNELRFRELQKQLEDQKRLTEEMKRKQEQGSMQLQGEVQELAIEEWLAAHFPLDTIEEIRKGVRGGDCIQTVHTRNQQNCGTIYYESKRTKDFQPAWIQKFKADLRDRGCHIGVLVTEVMPSDMPRMGLKEGIWICTYDEFKGLCTVLRESVIQLSTALVSQENRGDKMHLLYDFLTSNTFRMQVEAIVEGFSQMKADLDSEKRSMQRIWKQREKQIEKVITNTIDMYGSIKGIAGNAVQDVKALELPGMEDEEGNDE